MVTKTIAPVFAVIAALAIGISTSAFQNKSPEPVTPVKQGTVTPVRWYFNGIPGEENNPAKYQKTPVDGRECGGDGTLCSIMDVAGANPNEPGLTHGTVSVSNTTYLPEQLFAD